MKLDSISLSTSMGEGGKGESLANEELLNMQQAADYIHRSKSTMEKYSAARQIPKYRPNNGKVLFKRSDLDKFVVQFRLASCYELQMQAVSEMRQY